MFRRYLVCWFVLGEIVLLRGELWERDLSSAVRIGLSTSGYSAVDLRCGADHFEVNLTLRDDFQGVVYTRGSFHDSQPPCFKTHHHKTPSAHGNSLIALRIPFDRCGTLTDLAQSRHSNTLVLQHDPDLIMPGDAAFSLDCAFVPPLKASTDPPVNHSPFRSRITLVDADPSRDTARPHQPTLTALSTSHQVTFLPSPTTPKQEL